MNFDKQDYVAYSFVGIVFVLLAAFSINGEFFYGIFGDRDLVRSLQIFDYPLAYSAEMNFSASGERIIGSAQYYLIHFLMLFSKVPEWIAVSIQMLFCFSAIILYRMVRYYSENKWTPLFSLILYFMSPVMFESVLIIWNPAFIPLFVVLSLYFLEKSRRPERFAFRNVNIQFSVFFCLIALQMHMSVLLLLSVIIVYVFFVKEKLFDKFVIVISSLITVFVAYAGYFINRDVDFQATTVKTFVILNNYIEILFIAFIVASLISLSYMFVSKKNSWKLSFIACLPLVWFVVYTVFINGLVSSKDNIVLNEYPSWLTAPYNVLIDNKRLLKTFKDTVNMQKLDFTYEDCSIKIACLNVMVKKYNGDMSFAVFSDNHDYVYSLFLSPFYNLINNVKNKVIMEPYVFILMLLSFVNLMFLVNSRNYVLRSVVIVSACYSIFVLFSAADLFHLRYFIVVQILTVLASYKVIDFLFKKKVAGLFLSFLVLLNVIAAYFVFSMNYAGLSYKFVSGIDKFVRENNSNILHAAIFFKKDGYITGDARREIGFAYPHLISGKELDYYESKNDLCYAAFAEDISRDEMQGFYRNLISKNAIISDYQLATNVEGYKLFSYKTNTTKCFSSFDNKYVGYSNESYDENDINNIHINNEYLKMNIFFVSDGLLLTSREFRGTGFDIVKHRNGILKSLNIELTDANNKSVSFEVINSENFGFSSLNFPVKFKDKCVKDLEKGLVRYRINATILNKDGVMEVYRIIASSDENIREMIEDKFFENRSFAGKFILE